MSIFKPTKEFLKRLLHGKCENIIKADVSHREIIKKMFLNYFCLEPEKVDGRCVKATVIFNSIKFSIDDKLVPNGKIEIFADGIPVYDVDVPVSLAGSVTLDLSPAEGFMKMEMRS